MEDVDRAGQLGVSSEEYDAVHESLKVNLDEKDFKQHISDTIREYNSKKMELQGNKTKIDELNGRNIELFRRINALDKIVADWKFAFENAGVGAPKAEKKSYKKWHTFEDIQPLFAKVRNGMSCADFKKAYREGFENKYGEIKHIDSFYYKIRNGARSKNG